jgi:hypothetical protein
MLLMLVLPFLDQYTYIIVQHVRIQVVTSVQTYQTG